MPVGTTKVALEFECEGQVRKACWPWSDLHRGTQGCARRQVPPQLELPSPLARKASVENFLNDQNQLTRRVRAQYLGALLLKGTKASLRFQALLENRTRWKRLLDQKYMYD